MELEKLPGYNQLTSNHKKTAKTLKCNTVEFCNYFGINNVGFLTLSFGTHKCSKCGFTGGKRYNGKPKCPECGGQMVPREENEIDPGKNIAEARKCYNSFLTNVLRPRYGSLICVVERGDKYGRVHFHLLIDAGVDIKTGFNQEMFEELTKGLSEGRYKRYGKEWRAFYKGKGNVPESLSVEWKFLREIAGCYGFGTPQLTPIKSNEHAVSIYVSGYISKHITGRYRDDKGARLVSYTNAKEWRKYWSNFAYNTPRGWAFRMKVKTYCERYNVEYGALCDEIGAKKGLKYFFENVIIPMSLKGSGLVYPTKEHAELCGEDVVTSNEVYPGWVSSGEKIDLIPDGATNIKITTYPEVFPEEQIQEENKSIQDSYGCDPDWSVDPDFSEINTGQINPDNQRKLKAWVYAEQIRDRIDGFKPEFIGYSSIKKREAIERWNKRNELPESNLSNVPTITEFDEWDLKGNKQS